MKYHFIVAAIVLLFSSGCIECKPNPAYLRLDTDGDGWFDDEEADCGSDLADALSYPIDLDFDGICDIQDQDTDGDGFGDSEEYLCGSDPEDFHSVPEDLDNDGYCRVVDADDTNPAVGLGDPVIDYELPGLPPLPGGFPGGEISAAPGGRGGLGSSP